jgi:hypothetical protein
MTMLYPIVLEKEDNGAVSAYVPGLPVYAAADSHAQAERAIRTVLADFLEAHPASRPDARVRIARVSDRGTPRFTVVGVAALVGAKRSDAKPVRHVPTAGSAGARRARPGNRPGPRRRADVTVRRRGPAVATVRRTRRAA